MKSNPQVLSFNLVGKQLQQVHNKMCCFVQRLGFPLNNIFFYTFLKLDIKISSL